MTERDRPLIAGMRSSTSAKGGRLIALSIRGESPLLEEMLDRSELAQTVIHLYAPTLPENGAVDIHSPEVWAAGNPGLACGIKQVEHLRTEAIRVTATPSDLASFLAYELNLPQKPGREMIFAPADLAGCWVDTLPERAGPCSLGLDLAKPQAQQPRQRYGLRRGGWNSG